MANSGQTLLSLTEILPHTVTSTRSLSPVMLPFLQQLHQPRLLFQQDSARPHTARMVPQIFAANKVNILLWSARSPDLSPIEHLWDHLGQRIRRRPNPPMNRDQLVQALRQEWRAIPDDVIRRLTNSDVVLTFR